jgi:hypothetical protein
VELRARLEGEMGLLLVNGSHVGGDERCTVRCGCQTGSTAGDNVSGAFDRPSWQVKWSRFPTR